MTAPKAQVAARAAAAAAAPAVRIGDPYQALVNLSVPRRGDKDKQADLVEAGDVLYLTEDEAAQFNRHGPKDGRQIEVVRKLDGPAGNQVPRIPPRLVSGVVFRPGVPPPGSDAPRPDPEGSSKLITYDDRIPEAAEPAPGDEARETADAVDIAVRR